MNMTVWNVNDPPHVINFTSCYDPGTTYSLNLTIAENAQSCLKLTDPDIDIKTPYKDNLTYNFTFMSCTASGILPPGGNCSGKIPFSELNEVGLLNFTADNESWQGNYTYNLTVTDIKNEFAYAVVNISIYAVNDPPDFTSLLIRNETNNGTDETHYFPINETVIFIEGENYNLSLFADDEENNTPLFYNVSFTCSLETPGPCGLFAVGWATGKGNLTPTSAQTGNYTANFTARDSGNVTTPYNATGWQLVNMTVYSINKQPNIAVYSCYNSDCTNLVEGVDKLFWYKVNDPEEQVLTCYWYLDWLTATERLVSTESNCNSTSNQLYTYTPTYDDALNYTNATRTMTLLVKDPYGLKTNQNLTINIFDVNRPPRLLGNISSPIKWQSQTSITAVDLDNHFADDYGEVLEFTYLGATKIDVEIDPVTHEVTLTPVGGWYGTDWIVFVANDSILTNVSNNVTLIVEYKPPEVRPSPSTSYPSPRLASLDIIVPEIITIEAGHSSMAKVILHNDGQYDLMDVNLTTFTNETNISLQLQETFYEAISVGSSVTTWLNITVGELDVNLTYIVQVLADVFYPSIEESASITIKPLRTNKTEMIVKIVLVKDMFEENPECMELFWLIIEAEQSLDRGDIAEARRLTQLAIDNCQDMIDYAKLRRNQTGTGPVATVGQIIMNPLFIMGFVLAMLALIMIGYWLMIKRQPSRASAEAPV
jgi:hypothetical protein